MTCDTVSFSNTFYMYALLFTVAPDRAELSAPESMDVMEPVPFRCYANASPDVDWYIFQNDTDIVCNSTVDTCAILLHSINQVGPYTCYGSNNPVIGRQIGEQSEEHILTVLGTS